jgi:MoaA/NifB/PqqE/SkfB family radical SAM enzyme
VREETPVSLLLHAISDAAAEGFDTLGVSGGEPLLYRDLRQLLQLAGSLGLITTVTTNGMLITAAVLDELQPHLRLLAISLDGTPESHNHMRASPRAFEVMASRLDLVRAAGIPFGFIFTLTQHNLDELEWVAAFALEQGAALLQVHALEEVGRASSGELRGAAPDDREAGHAYLETLRLQAEVGERLYVQFDYVELPTAREHPELLFADDGPIDVHQPLSELVSPLVIETDATVVPLQHGFGRAFVLGSLHAEPLPALAARWRAHGHQRFRALCRQTLAQQLVHRRWPLMNWYDEVSRASRRIDARADTLAMV